MVFKPSGLATTQFLSYDASLRFTHAVMKQRMVENMMREIDVVRDRYDGSSLRPMEQEIERLFKRKTDIADNVAAVSGSLDRIANVREPLAELRSLADEGSVAGFKSKFIYLNSQAGSRVLDADNLVGRMGNGRWREDTRLVGVGKMDVAVSARYIGNDWSITLDSGQLLTADHSADTLSGGGVNLQMADLTLIERDGDSVTFTDGTDTYTGTLRRGGGGVLSPWLYNNFATADDRQEAMDDVSAAMKRLGNVERDLRQAEALLTGGVNSLDSQMKDLSDRHQKLQTEELDARAAAIKAIQTRQEMSERAFAVSANTSLEYIERMFLTPMPGTEKPSLFGTLSNSHKSFF